MQREHHVLASVLPEAIVVLGDTHGVDDAVHSDMFGVLHGSAPLLFPTIEQFRRAMCAAARVPGTDGPLVRASIACGFALSQILVAHDKNREQQHRIDVISQAVRCMDRLCGYDVVVHESCRELLYDTLLLWSQRRDDDDAVVISPATLDWCRRVLTAKNTDE